MRTSLIGAVVVASALLSGGAPVQSAAPAGAVARLRPGVPAFWVGSARPVESIDGGRTGRVYPLDVPAGGWRLRVSFDHPDFRDGYDFSVVSPDGQETHGTGYTSSEIAIDRPQAGRWQVRASMVDPADTRFRLRALLERSAPTRGRGRQQLLPNLRLVPPHEFTFSGGLGSLAGLGPNVQVGGVGCTPDDIASYQPTRCLRFSLGPANLGPGPFEMVFESGQGIVTPGQAKQRIHLADGSVVERLAGEFEYHKTHAHYHHTGFGTLELMKVTNPAKGTMVRAGTGPKQGFCTADIMLAEWSSFANDPQNASPSQCLAEGGSTGHNNPTGTAMAISVGWADLYSWEQDGNFVDFGTNGDGRYVVRSTADAAGHVLESNENDNTSYAYIEVKGESIRVLERGIGTSPWDKRKRLATDWLNPVAAQ